MPWTDEAAWILASRGEQAVSCVLRDYDFPGGMNPYPFQLQTVNDMCVHRRYYSLMEMGLGKTNCTIWAAHYLLSIGAIKKILVVGTLSTLTETWANSIFRICMPETATVVHGSTRAAKKKKVTNAGTWTVINFDGIVSMSEVLQRQNYDLIVVDEARTYSLHTTARWKALKKLIKNETRVIGLTGSPRPKSPMDVHGISKLITPDNMPYSRTHWQMTTMNRIAEFTWVEKPESNALCIRALQPGRVVNKRDVLKDLPEKTFSFVPVQLSEQQAAYYVELKKNKLVTIAGAGDIVGVNGAVLINKLAQVAAGAVIDDAGNVQVFECKDRMDTMKRLADESLSGVMILAPYRATVAMIMREMGPLGYRSITGDVGVTERTEILAGINSGEIPGIVCTPGTVSHGVSLQGCSTTIWFSSINSSEIEIQANNRMDRPGQKHPQNIYCLFGSQVERAMYASVKGQQATQQELLSMFNETSNSF